MQSHLYRRYEISYSNIKIISIHIIHLSLPCFCVIQPFGNISRLFSLHIFGSYHCFSPFTQKLVVIVVLFLGGTVAIIISVKAHLFVLNARCAKARSNLLRNVTVESFTTASSIHIFSCKLGFTKLSLFIRPWHGQWHRIARTLEL